MTLDFNIKVISKQIEPPFEFLFCLLFTTFQDRLRNMGANAAGGGDQAFMIALDKLLIDTGVFGI